MLPLSYYEVAVSRDAKSIEWWCVLAADATQAVAACRMRRDGSPDDTITATGVTFREVPPNLPSCHRINN